MDPLDTMTAADWRRCYESTQAYATDLLEQGVALSRREAELVDRLRRREERVRELEEENQRLRDVLENVSCAGTLDEVSDALDKANNI